MKRRANRAAALALVAAIAGAALGGCAPQTAVPGPDDQGAVTGDPAPAAAAWSESSDCATCHERQAASAQDAQCLASSHRDAACASCHADTAGLEKVHAKAGAGPADATRLKKTGIDADYCLTCHGDRTALAEATAQSDACTDKNGLTVNPHDVPDNAEHGDIDCSSCHLMHDGRDVREQADSLCSSCHHENVYECFTCHA